MTVHPVYLWLVAFWIATFLVITLVPRLWEHKRRCDHGASSLVMTNGKVSRPHRTGCLP